MGLLKWFKKKFANNSVSDSSCIPRMGSSNNNYSINDNVGYRRSESHEELRMIDTYLLVNFVIETLVDTNTSFSVRDGDIYPQETNYEASNTSRSRSSSSSSSTSSSSSSSSSSNGHVENEIHIPTGLRNRLTKNAYEAYATKKVLTYTSGALLPVDAVPDIVGYKMCLVVSDVYGHPVDRIAAIISLQIPGKARLYKSHVRDYDSRNREFTYKRVTCAQDYVKDLVARKGKYEWEQGEKYAASDAIVRGIAFFGDEQLVRKYANEYINGRHYVCSDFEYTEYKKQITQYALNNIIQVPDAGEQGRGCCKGVHFFLRPEYCVDYAWYGANLINVDSPVWSKRLNPMKDIRG